MADAELDHLREASASPPSRGGALAFVRLVFRAAAPWVAAAIVTASSLEPQLAPHAPDPILFEDQAPPAPRPVPKSDPDVGHSLALLPA